MELAGEKALQELTSNQGITNANGLGPAAQPVRSGFALAAA